VTIETLVDDRDLRSALPAVEVTQGFLERLDAEEPALHAFITVTPELALADARRVDDARAAGRRLPLDGMPVALKDNVDVAGVRRTVGSRLFEGHVAASDAGVVSRLRAAGAVIVGKTNMHELAFGGTSANETFGAVVNPWRPGRIPGGSSGGSGVAVAADLCVAAIGTDTGGSIRLPAAFTGVTGLRPTYGAVSTRGVFPVARSLDTVGPLARSVLDVASVLAAIAGHDPWDPWSVDLPAPSSSVTADVSGLQIGLPHPFFFDALEPEVEATVLAAAAALRDLGANVFDIELRGSTEAVEVCGVLIKAEALALHEQDLRERPELFEEGTRRRLALAEDVRALDLVRLSERAAEWRAAVRRSFQGLDLMLTPTTPGPAPPAGEVVTTTAAVVPFTHAISLAGTPALSIPCGLTADGLPVGVQLVAAPGRDDLVLRAGAAYQSATGWHRLRPPARARDTAVRSYSEAEEGGAR
jgi:aspartyl-tRNA(Asn)/glutamyl-tRNA(Gln) amidotransferase subunit A